MKVKQSLLAPWAPMRKHRGKVVGAPYQPGQRVKVIGPNAPGDVDEEMCAPYLGCVGVVEELRYRTGCGDRFPQEPMILVLLDDGRRYDFWRNELRKEVVIGEPFAVSDISRAGSY